MLKKNYSGHILECGCDEAGRGCLAGPVIAAAVILPENFASELLNDSKKLNKNQRDELRIIIEKEAVTWSVGVVDNNKIDKINILNASILAMHKAITGLKVSPEFIIVDGNRFNSYKKIPHETIVKGDGKYLSIAAASVLAKTHRDELMIILDDQFPQYGWKQNKAYPTKKHKAAIKEFGKTSLHRLTFKSD